MGWPRQARTREAGKPASDSDRVGQQDNVLLASHQPTGMLGAGACRHGSWVIMGGSSPMARRGREEGRSGERGGLVPPPPHGRTKHKLSCHFLAKIFVAEGSPPGSFLLGIAPRSQNTKCSPTPTPTLTILVKKSLFDRPTSVIMRALRWHGVGHGPIVCRGRVGGRRGAGSGARPFTLSF